MVSGFGRSVFSEVEQYIDVGVALRINSTTLRGIEDQNKPVHSSAFPRISHLDSNSDSTARVPGHCTFNNIVYLVTNTS